MQQAGDILRRNAIVTTKSIDEWRDLAVQYGIPYEEIGLIDLNRTGVSLDTESIKVGGVTKFNASLLYSDHLAEYILPVRSKSEVSFHQGYGGMFISGIQIGITDTPELDETSPAYHSGQLTMPEMKTIEIANFIPAQIDAGLDFSKLERIIVGMNPMKPAKVTLEYLRIVIDAAARQGFHGLFVCFGNNFMKKADIADFAKLSGDKVLVYELNNVGRRLDLLTKTDSSLTVEDFYRAMDTAKTTNIRATFTYAVGIDALPELAYGFEVLHDAVTLFPFIDILQVTSDAEAKCLHDSAKSLSYYIRARLAIEEVFNFDGIEPERWQSKHPLWYQSFASRKLTIAPDF